MKNKNYITITNFLPQVKGNSINFAPTGSNSLAEWVKMDNNNYWIHTILEKNNTDICLYTDGERSLEDAAHLVLSDAELMEKYIWKDTVAYTQAEMINMIHLNDNLSWHDLAFADRLIINDEFPSNYYFAKKVNPNALSYDKKINKLLTKVSDNNRYIESINDYLNIFILPISASTDEKELLHIMNSILIGGNEKILRLEGTLNKDGHCIKIKKTGEHLVHSIQFSKKNQQDYIFGVMNDTNANTNLLLDNLCKNITPAIDRIEDIMAHF
ncbi:hypothetical protein MY04_1097 [Flammeovirga sp. MY04]|uniref:hypothetical protein n=1 Tax=Flammeovirga sp. MY04 TaxID=1191459 RepID=UPI0008061E61|nr:hypothetical protein [Flammeovirga sp. MY04]ANQ48474.1 hypothetical protein MY04_1097 [Flammeovirga sp. MY04]